MMLSPSVDTRAGALGCTFGHVKPVKRTGNWTPEGKAERAALRRDYLELTAGQRVEQAIVLSRELTRLAARGLTRA